MKRLMVDVRYECAIILLESWWSAQIKESRMLINIIRIINIDKMMVRVTAKINMRYTRLRTQELKIMMKNRCHLLNFNILFHINIVYKRASSKIFLTSS